MDVMFDGLPAAAEVRPPLPEELPPEPVVPPGVEPDVEPGPKGVDPDEPELGVRAAALTEVEPPWMA
jgi:hypothetical protein